MTANSLGLQDLVSAMPIAAAVVDRWGRIVCANEDWDRVGEDLVPLFVGDLDLAPGAATIRAALEGTAAEGAANVELSVDPDSGEARFATVRAVPIGGSDEFYLATSSPIDDVNLDSSVLMDRHTVTGVPGRQLFLEFVHRAIAMAGRHPWQPAVLAVEVDGLDTVERVHGRAARRELVVAMASRFRAGLRPSDVVAQPSAESFLLLLPDIVNPENARDVAERLVAEHSQPFRVGDERIRVSIRIGVSVCTPAMSADRLVTAAEEALERTRRTPDGPVVDLTDTVVVPPVAVAGEEPTPRRVVGAGRRIDLREMREEELVSFYQPIFDVHDGHVVAGEALMRWRHPHYGVLSAGEFLGLAVNAGMLGTITDQALVRATEMWADIHDRLGVRPPKLFVNLSPEQLLSRVAVDRLYHLLVATGLPSSDVVVEVTEEAMATRFGEMISVLNELRAQGLHVALDDFGSGYSSLGRLRHLPVDVIKVDQSMVRGLEADHRARQLLAAVSTMARELDVDCIVEGIETAGEARIVAELGFRFVQGYHFGRPVPADEFVDLVIERQVSTNA